MLRKTPFIAGEYYHIYNRGTDKRVIFTNDHDYNRFMALLYLCNNINAVNIEHELRKGLAFTELMGLERENTLVDIGTYCLMPNHFHILIQEKEDGGISRFIQKLCTAYSMYFNKKYERKGSLFEGPFKTKHVGDEAYFSWLFSYIHLNPVKLIDSDWKKAGISNTPKAKEFMDNYKYSSYHDYFIGNRAESVIVNKEIFPEHFLYMNDFEELLRELKEDNYE